jgi:hypothetical protein
MTIHLVLAALGGLIIGSAMTFAASAQKPPPAYFIAESVVTDPQATAPSSQSFPQRLSRTAAAISPVADVS